MKNIGLLLITLCLSLHIANAERTVWYVHHDSTLNTIQAGLDSCADNDIVLVAPGTYHENIIWPNTQGIHLVSELGPEVTIIDGDSIDRVLTVSVDVETTTMINGFTIQRGYDTLGAGVLCSSEASPVLINNIVIDNVAGFVLNIVGRGAGIFCDSACSPIIANNSIVNNRAGGMSARGGGIFCLYSSAKIVNNHITSNTAGAWFGAFGGGIHCDHSSPEIYDNNIAENVAGAGAEAYGGGICCVDSSSPTIAGCVISQNTGWCGSGICCLLASPLITACTISNNTNVGIYCYGSNAVVNNNGIFGNNCGMWNSAGGITIDAENNWWGDSTGPYHPTLNPGGLGDTVSDYVDFNPWLYSPGIEEYTASPPVKLYLQVTPNPFLKLTTVSFSIEQSAERIALQIYDATGRLVRDFSHAMPHAPCAMQISWDGTDQSDRQLPAGVYFITLEVGEFIGTEKVLLVR